MKIYEKLYRAIKRHSELDDEEIIQAAEHGANAGWNGFNYNREVERFYKNNTKKIWKLLEMCSEDFGHDNILQFLNSMNGVGTVQDQFSFIQLLVYYTLETVGQWLMDQGSIEE